MPRKPKYPWRFVTQTAEQKIEGLNLLVEMVDLPLAEYIQWAAILSDEPGAKPKSWPKILGFLPSQINTVAGGLGHLLSVTIVTASGDRTGAPFVYHPDAEDTVFRLRGPGRVVREPDSLIDGVSEWQSPNGFRLRIQDDVDGTHLLGVLTLNGTPVFSSSMDNSTHRQVFGADVLAQAMNAFLVLHDRMKHQKSAKSFATVLLAERGIDITGTSGRVRLARLTEDLSTLEALANMIYNLQGP